MQATLTGVKEIDQAIRKLSSKEGDKVAKAAISGGLAELAKSIKKEAPKGATGTLRKSIGKRFERQKGQKLVTAKAGVNVGKQKKTAESMNGKPRAPHSHLVALGTQPRTRKKIGGKWSYITDPTDKQLSTGVMPSNPFVRLGTSKAQSKILGKMTKNAAKAMERQALKARKKG
jgi:hypothetical protein